MHDLLMSLVNTERWTPRGKQTSVGPSEIKGCRRRTWHRLEGTPQCNEDTLILPAWMGTALHKDLERRLILRDPFRERYETEVRVEHNGMRGHVDVYDREAREVIDWKSSTKSSLRDFPSEQQITQVQLYGYLLTANGRPVDTVTLVAIPRDGNETHLKSYSEPYDPAVAEAGLAWLEDVKSRIEPPEPEKPRRFCQGYCPYYDASGTVGCPSKGGR